MSESTSDDLEVYAVENNDIPDDPQLAYAEGLKDALRLTQDERVRKIIANQLFAKHFRGIGRGPAPKDVRRLVDQVFDEFAERCAIVEDTTS